ncbi:MAG: N-6 DNA methylase, partial [Thermoflexibacteraceae bacterium]
MSLQLINQYYNELHRAKQFGGSKNETSIRGAFLNLVNGLARPKNLELVPEISIKSSIGTTVRPDGVLRNILQLDYGFWESKDSKDDIFEEIEEKFRKGYPTNNILFEDTQTAVLFQDNTELKVAMQDAEGLLALLQQFIGYERSEVKEFNKAIGQFSEDLPNVLAALRKMIDTEVGSNATFAKESSLFLTLCQESINPNLVQKDVWEMLIQHILTEEIFMSIFGNADYHRENNIAQSLYKVEKTFFRGETKQNLLASIRPYYNTVKARASELISHADKQNFLKAIYENFYKAYNPKGADRLGIVYTPTEIVKFMIEGTEFLLEKHFKKTLGSPNIEILDPCTGTGTFVTELIEHIPPHQLA